MDIDLGSTHDFKFSTSVGGVLTTLIGSPVVSAYVGNSTTEITAGITLSVNFDGLTGMHNVRVVATSGNGFATATDVKLVLTAGTVGGVSVVGRVVAEFTIANESTDVTLATILAAVDTEVAAIKTKTDNLPEGVQKNTQLTAFTFFMADSSDHVSGKTGATVTAERSLDGGAFAACANVVAEIGVGVYKITLAAADLNADIVTLKFTASGCDATIITIKTEA